MVAVLAAVRLLLPLLAVPAAGEGPGHPRTGCFAVSLSFLFYRILLFPLRLLLLLFWVA